MRRAKEPLKIRELMAISLFTALIAMGAFIRIPIPLIPFTLQFLFTMLAGLLLGARQGTISVGLYLLLGLIGLPIFSQGGGFHYLFHPTFGYLIGFLAATYVTARIAHRVRVPSFGRLLAANLVGLVIVYGIGLFYYYWISRLYLHNPVGLGTLFLYGFLLAVPGDIGLTILAAAAAKRLLPLVNPFFQGASASDRSVKKLG